jgi:hypothetical protein
MAEGTINLVNNSTTLTGVGTDFASKVTPGDFIYVEIATVPYTLPVDIVNSDSSITLLRKFTGPTTSGLVWVHIPRRAQNAVYSALVDQVSQALLQALINEDNWQKLLTEDGEVTITRPDGSTFKGPSWKYIIETHAGALPLSAQALSVDLNTLVNASAAGVYYQTLNANATPANHYPIAEAGTLLVTPSAYGCQQEYTAFSTGRKFIRGLRGGNEAWQDWSEFYGLNNPNEIVSKSVNSYRMVYGNYGAFWRQDGNRLYLMFTNSGDQYGSYNNLRPFYVDLDTGHTVMSRLYLSDFANFDARYQRISSYFQASDGTLKTASPVIKIFPDGTYENNDESEGVTVSRLDVGQYLIEGCEALNSDAAWGGWDGGFDIPTDRNKQPLIWLDYDVNPDGSVLVSTYHRTHPDSPEFARNLKGYKNDAGDFIETVKDGEPVDIPSDQFVSVRVEMPQDSIWNKRQKELDDIIDSETANQQAITGDEGEQD